MTVIEDPRVVDALSAADVDLDTVEFTPDGMTWITGDGYRIALGEDAGDGGEWWDAYDHDADRAFDGGADLNQVAREIARYIRRHET